MVLDPYQMGYFITQVGLAAASFGVAGSDISAVAMALEKLFDYRCAPKTTVIPAQGAQYQAICTDQTCPLEENSTCANQPMFAQPLVANVTLAMGEGRNATSSSMAVPLSMSTGMPSGMPSGSSSTSSSGSVPMKTSTSAGSQLSLNVATILGLIMALAVCL